MLDMQLYDYTSNLTYTLATKECVGCLKGERAKDKKKITRNSMNAYIPIRH